MKRLVGAPWQSRESPSVVGGHSPLGLTAFHRERLADAGIAPWQGALCYDNALAELSI
jgi:hypothetical protein